VLNVIKALDVEATDVNVSEAGVSDREFLFTAMSVPVNVIKAANTTQIPEINAAFVLDIFFNSFPVPKLL